MISFGVIGFLVLILIYFVVRQQSMQAEINLLRNQNKALDSTNRFSLRTLVNLSGQLQKLYQIRLDSLQKHALISSEDFALAQFIVSQVEFVIMQCCEKRATVEEAINKALSRSDFDMPQINKFIAKQPSEIRIPWCKNQVGGFVAACHNLTSERIKKDQQADTDQPSSDAS